MADRRQIAIRLAVEGAERARAELEAIKGAARKAGEDAAPTAQQLAAWERLNRVVDGSYRATDTYARVVERVNAAERAGIGTAEQRNRLLEQAAMAHARATGAMELNAGGTRNLSAAMGQAGFQLQDFAVQVSMGQNALVAFGAQASQLAGFFGAGGAVAGAAITVGVLAAQLLGAGTAADALDAAMGQVEGSYRRLNDLAELRSKGIEEEAEAVGRLSAAYGSLGAAGQRAERVVLDRQRDALIVATTDLRAQSTARIADLAISEEARRSQAFRVLDAGSAVPNLVPLPATTAPDLAAATRALETYGSAARLTADVQRQFAASLDEAARLGGGNARAILQQRDAVLDLLPRVVELDTVQRQHAIQVIALLQAQGAGREEIERYAAAWGPLTEEILRAGRTLAAARNAAVDDPLAATRAEITRNEAVLAALQTGGVAGAQSVQSEGERQAEITRRTDALLAQFRKDLQEAGVDAAEAAARVDAFRETAVRMSVEAVDSSRRLRDAIEGRTKAERDAENAARDAAAAVEASYRRMADLAERRVKDVEDEAAAVARLSSAYGSLGEAGQRAERLVLDRQAATLDAAAATLREGSTRHLAGIDLSAAERAAVEAYGTASRLTADVQRQFAAALDEAARLGGDNARVLLQQRDAVLELLPRVTELEAAQRRHLSATLALMGAQGAGRDEIERYAAAWGPLAEAVLRASRALAASRAAAVDDPLAATRAEIARNQQVLAALEARGVAAAQAVQAGQSRQEEITRRSTALVDQFRQSLAASGVGAEEAESRVEAYRETAVRMAVEVVDSNRRVRESIEGRSRAEREAARDSQRLAEILRRTVYEDAPAGQMVFPVEAVGAALDRLRQRQTEEDRRRAEELRREEERRADENGRRLDGSVQRWGDALTDTTYNALEAGAARGENVFQSLAGGFGSTLRRAAAEALSSVVFQPMVRGAFGALGYTGAESGPGSIWGSLGNLFSLGGGVNNLTGGGLTGALGLDGLASSVSGLWSSTGLGGVAQTVGDLGVFAEGAALNAGTGVSLGGIGLGSILGAAGAGALGGGMLASLTGGNSTGGSIGGGVGAAAGYALAASGLLGPLGPLAGALLLGGGGGLLGGLFGPGAPNPAYHIAIGADAAGSLGILNSDAKHIDEQLQQALAVAGQQVASLNALMASAGVRASGSVILGKDGADPNRPLDLSSGIRNLLFSAVDEALNAEIAGRSFASTDELARVISNATARRSEIPAIERGIEVTTLRAEGREREADWIELNAAREAEWQSTRDRLREIGVAQPEIDRIIASLWDAYAAQDRAAKAQREAAEAQEEAARASGARGLLEDLAFGGLSTLTAEARAAAAQASLDAARAGLTGEEGLGEYARVARATLPVLREVYGTTERYGALVAEVGGTLRAAGGDTAGLAALLEANAAGVDRQTEALLGLGGDQLEVLDRIRSELTLLRGNLEALARRIAAA
jgi:hypothetical protein